MPGGEHAPHVLHDRNGRLELLQYLHVLQIERLPLVGGRVVEGIADIACPAGYRVGLARGAAEEHGPATV